MYTCTRLCFHTTEPKFFAQTNGDYIAEFSALPPYRINKCKRFDGHKVSQYSLYIHCLNSCLSHAVCIFPLLGTISELWWLSEGYVERLLKLSVGLSLGLRFCLIRHVFLTMTSWFVRGYFVFIVFSSLIWIWLSVPVWLPEKVHCKFMTSYMSSGMLNATHLVTARNLP